MKYVLRLLSLLVVGLCAVPSSAFAQTKMPDLSHLTLEDLMRIEVTSASRKDQSARDVTAAVFVITQDDIRRSGMTSLPDLLRLAPGVDVAQFNSNKWAVSVRGFNALFSNKLLVLIDGRSAYSRIFSGVLWDAEDVMIDDIDRIEVVRGPGAALWGANAVNGVINIVTKRAADTAGALVRVEAGGYEQQGAARYGGSLRGASYRIYSQWTGREASLVAPGTPADDASHRVTIGFRSDWGSKPDVFMVEADYLAGQTRPMWLNLDPQTAASEPVANVPSDEQVGHVLGRWTHTRPGGASLQIQSFVDVGGRQEYIGDYTRRLFDLDTQYHTVLRGRHDLVAGAGYRFIDEHLASISAFSLFPPDNNSSLVTAFAQDEIQLLANRLSLTVGSQAQYDSESGAGVQPTVRAMWKALPRQRLWAATSRALRTSSLADRSLHLVYPPAPTASGLPLVVTVLGNPAADTEVLVDAEVGYRLEIGRNASIDVTGYVGHYDKLVTREVGAPVLQRVPSPQILVTTQFGNLLQATTRGLEISGHWAPLSSWHLDGSYTGLHVSPEVAAGSKDPNAALEDGSAPQTQWQLRSAFSPTARTTLNVALFHVGRLEQFKVPAYTRADINTEWRLSSHLAVAATGQNLFDGAHAEFADLLAPLRATQVARSGSVTLRWTFR